MSVSVLADELEIVQDESAFAKGHLAAPVEHALPDLGKLGVELRRETRTCCLRDRREVSLLKCLDDIGWGHPWIFLCCAA